jgi:hypothetical protein
MKIFDSVNRKLKELEELVDLVNQQYSFECIPMMDSFEEQVEEVVVDVKLKGKDIPPYSRGVTFPSVDSAPIKNLFKKHGYKSELKIEPAYQLTKILTKPLGEGTRNQKAMIIIIDEFLYRNKDRYGLPNAKICSKEFLTLRKPLLDLRISQETNPDRFSRLIGLDPDARKKEKISSLEKELKATFESFKERNLTFYVEMIRFLTKTLRAAKELKY